ncbi:gamma-glutamylcyclotransferase family protein [Humitalea sp. 24SJ18S-53]|uniref:gamma-glutamylcyclotransferase family protein n=1 Tax=Humitalea sp. 24SJ18S-53 TaxID=3422307 RepID=UPI003D67BABB
MIIGAILAAQRGLRHLWQRMTDTLYAAYGSNLNRTQMAARCPAAVSAGGVLVPGWRLAFNKWALIERDPEAEVAVGLWTVTPACLTSLDRFEGVPHAYVRDLLPLPDGRQAVVYHDVAARPGPPSLAYVQRIRAGYRDFGFDLSGLAAALARIDFRR